MPLTCAKSRDVFTGTDPIDDQYHPRARPFVNKGSLPTIGMCDHVPSGRPTDTESECANDMSNDFSSSGPGPAVDGAVPPPARLWDYLPGGKDYYAVHQEAGGQDIAGFPGILD